jgi:hypothetical protein
MKRSVAAELYCIIKDIEAGALVADETTEKRLQEVRRDFIESMKKSLPLKNLNPEELWDRIKNDIRKEIRRRPDEWRSV